MTDATLIDSSRQASWRDYYDLCKPRVVLLMLLCSIVGMFLATPGIVSWQVLLFGNLGIALVAGSAAAANHLVDAEIDAKMARTQNRPIVQGRVDRIYAHRSSEVAACVVKFQIKARIRYRCRAGNVQNFERAVADQAT